MNKKLEYLCIAENNIFFSLEDHICEADTGEASTVAEGKELLTDIIDKHIQELNEFKEDIAKLSFGAFKKKYD